MTSIAILTDLFIFMEIYKKLKEFGQVKINEPLSKHTTFKIGGPADFFVMVDSTDKLVELLNFVSGEGVDYFLIGGGSNMLASDAGFRGVVISTQKNKGFRVEGDLVVVEAGYSTVEVAQSSMKAGLTGFEWGVGVPGTIGGAVRGNAGATGGETKDVVEKVEVYRDGEIVALNNEECRFNYRDSIFKHNTDIILRVYLRLKKSENKELIKTALKHLQYRNTTQPQGYSSTGCIFKNLKLETESEKELKKLKGLGVPQEFLVAKKIPAGWLVQEAGMKGESVGQAQVSERHGNFIVNLGGATAQNVMDLIEKIKEKVYDKFGVELEEEIRII